MPRCFLLTVCPVHHCTPAQRLHPDNAHPSAQAQRRAFAARTFLERQELEVALASSCYDEGAEREELETAMEMSEQETAINDAIDRSLSSAQEQVEQATEEKVPPRLSPATHLPSL